MAEVVEADQMSTTHTVSSLAELREEALAELAATEPTDQDRLEAWRVKYLGRRGRLTQVLRTLGSMPVEERRTTGAAANELKSLLQEVLTDRQNRARAASRAKAVSEAFDVTLPGRRHLKGRFHPVTQTIRDVTEAFGALGFRVVEGPFHEFRKGNFPFFLQARFK